MSRQHILLLMMISLVGITYAETLADEAKVGAFSNEIYNMRMGLIIPFILLFATLVAAFMDVGVIGVAVGSITGIVAGWLLQIIPVDYISMIGFILIIIITIWKTQ